MSCNKLDKIIIHWTAGRYYPTQLEKQHYHFLIDKEGKIFNGIYKPEDNINCVDKIYAAHCGGGNTGAIGVAMCGMYGFKSNKNIGNFPILPIQFESCMLFCAELASKYNIEISKDNILTHYEFGQAHPKTTSFGKIYIIYLPTHPWVAKNEIGSFIRSKIRWYKERG